MTMAAIRWRENPDTENATADGKGGSASDVKLRRSCVMRLPHICARTIADASSASTRFRFHQGGGHLTFLLIRAKLKALGISTPFRRPSGWRQPPNRFQRVNFKVFWAHLGEKRDRSMKRNTSH